MYYDPKQFDKMMRDSGLKMKDIADKSGISRQTLYDLTKESNIQRLTLQKILAVADAIKMSPADYFDIPSEQLQWNSSGEAGSLGEIKTMIRDVQDKVNSCRDDYIQSLQNNIKLQDEVIKLLRQQQSDQ
jgi:DNA-binding Xre family transcriptional regulator